MDIEDIARKGFPAGRPAQQQGKLAIGARVLGQVVVNDQDVAPRLHEVFRDAGRRIRRDIGQAGRIVAFADHDDGVVHRAARAKFGDNLGHGGRALADGAVYAEDILAALAEDGCRRRWSSCPSAGRPESVRADPFLRERAHQ